VTSITSASLALPPGIGAAQGNGKGGGPELGLPAWGRRQECGHIHKHYTASCGGGPPGLHVVPMKRSLSAALQCLLGLWAADLLWGYNPGLLHRDSYFGMPPSGCCPGVLRLLSEHTSVWSGQQEQSFVWNGKVFRTGQGRGAYKTM